MLMRFLTLIALSAVAVPAQFREISVDASRAVGEIRPLAGFNLPAEPSALRALAARARDFSGLRARIVPGAELPSDTRELLIEAGIRVHETAGGATELGAEGQPRFFKWTHSHSRNHDPFELVRLSRRVRERLDRAGEASLESILADWRLGAAERSELYRASFAASAVIYLQDAPLDAAFFWPSAARLVRDDGFLSGEGAVLAALARFRLAPRRLALEGADTIGLAALAGRSTDGQLVAVLISNFERRDAAPRESNADTTLPPRPPETFRYRDNEGFVLRVRNLPWGAGDFRVERYRLSEAVTGEPTDRGAGRGGEFLLVERMPPPGVELIVLRREDVPSSEYIIRRRGRTGRR